MLNGFRMCNSRIGYQLSRRTIRFVFGEQFGVNVLFDLDKNIAGEIVARVQYIQIQRGIVFTYTSTLYVKPPCPKLPK